MKIFLTKLISNSNLPTYTAVLLFFFTPLYIITFLLGNYELISPMYILTNMSFVLVFQSILYIIFKNTKISIWITSITIYIFHIINEIVFNLRHTHIVPSDFYSFTTATKIINNYNITITKSMIFASITLILLLILSHIYHIKKEKKIFISSIISLIIGIAIVLAIPHNKVEEFNSTLSNKYFGTLQTLYLNFLKSHITMPENYSDDLAISILKQYTASDATYMKPNIIAIMDEAFSDMTIHDKYATALEAMPFITSLSDNTIKGNLLVPTLGSNTCNTEFEFLTGHTLAFWPNSIPYQQHILNKTDSLVSQLKTLNYKTIAIHPYWKECWERDRVYPLFGFEEFIDGNKFDSTKDNSNRLIDYKNSSDFGNLKYIRKNISDEESFNQIIKQFESKQKDKPIFIFNVTMQNHAPYNYSGEDFIEKTYLTDTTESKANQYFNLINETDKAFNNLINYFSNIDEPTIILFFGDHQPNLITPDDSSIENLQKSYTLPFLLWANYDIEEKNIPLISSNYLSLLLLETANLPLTEYDLFRKDLLEKYPALNPHGALSNKHWIPISEIDASNKEKISILQYYLLFQKYK